MTSPHEALRAALKADGDEKNVAELMRNLLVAKPDHWKQCFEKPEMIGWFVGQIMKETDGRADPDLVRLTFEFAIRAEKAELALEASQPMLSGGDGMVMVPREAIKQMAERLDAGGRRLKTAGNACEEVEAQLRALIGARP